MKDYNGFEGKHRTKVGNIINLLIKNGDIQGPNECCMCGQKKGTLHYHLEDYTLPLKVEELRPICVGCHMRLHIRFNYPNLWKQHLIDLRFGKKSPAYLSAFAFFSAMKRQGIIKDIDFVEPLSDPKEWFEVLKLEKIDLLMTNKNE